MSPLRAARIANKVLKQIAQTDMRFAGDVNENQYLWSQDYNIDGEHIRIEILFRYRTNFGYKRTGDYFDPPEGEIITTIDKPLEYYVYHLCDGLADDGLIYIIDEGLDHAIYTALDRGGRIKKRIV